MKSEIFARRAMVDQAREDLLLPEKKLDVFNMVNMEKSRLF